MKDCWKSNVTAQVVFRQISGELLLVHCCSDCRFLVLHEKESEYDQEIPQSHTADQPMVL